MLAQVKRMLDDATACSVFEVVCTAAAPWNLMEYHLQRDLHLIVVLILSIMPPHLHGTSNWNGIIYSFHLTPLAPIYTKK